MYLRFITGPAFVYALCFAAPALADKVDDFRTAASKSGCDAIPYTSEWRDCGTRRDAKERSCKDFGCSRGEVEKLLERLKEKRQNLADAKSRNNEAAVPDLERAIATIEEDLKTRKDEAYRRIRTCDECIAARKAVQKLFADVKAMVQGEADPLLQPYIEKLVAHYDKGAAEHVKPLEEVVQALDNCKWVSSVSY